MYHSISAQRGQAPTDLAVASADFRAQVDALKSDGYDAVLPRELILALDGKMRLPKRPVVFAFDDTLQSVHDLAFPILAEAGYRAVVYAVAGQIGGHNAWDDGKDMPYEPCMGDGSLALLQMAGWEIGSHTMTHADLTKLAPEALWHEVAGSKARLEARFGRIESFSYPYAAYSPTVRQAVVDAGYTNATAHRVRTRSVTADRFALKRVFVKGPENLATFRRKVSGVYLAYRGLVRT
jgi:peptidoglycan/xylan/chitin deacetylase (PgdA/CDA1 family)